MRQVTASDFEALFGLPKLPSLCEQLVGTHDFRYDVPTGSARDRIVLEVMQHVESDKPTQVGEHRAGIWETCWSDNLQRFIDGGHDPDKLVPDFIKPGQPIRLKQDYVIPVSPSFELDFFQVCRAFLFDRFFRDTQSVYEFGCGSGFNLIALAGQLPGKKLCGLDWSRSSNEVLNLAGEKLGLELTGRKFDFFRPDTSVELGSSSGVLTMCALEQVGSRHGSFVDFLLAKKPSICVNMEPLLELYDEKQLVDYLAIKFHRKRGYLDRFLTSLHEREAEGTVQIIEQRRFHFGSIYHEGYSYVAWKPI